MKKTICYCDRCSAEIKYVAYTLTCYAEDLKPGPFGGVCAEAMAQNVKQNMSFTERHLCRKCKDEITDGIFVV